ncbi:MAG: hypothetical protein ACD_72C00390G0002 [uncultured bacterium]|nr:MAG: hypothetical protein ACD_72C00390G0002 [uncultured bacterium]
MKLEQRKIAETLRKNGASYGEILELIKVSKSTLSLWLRNITLTNEQKNKLYKIPRQINAYNLAKKNQDKKILITKIILDESILEVEKLIDNKLFLAGLMLYWAEGDKAEMIEAVKFTNSDPIMIKLMMRWFREICEVPEEKIRIALNIHELHNQKEIENYWSKITEIPLSQFNKTFVKPSALTFKRNLLYNGTCSIRVSNKNLFRKIKGWKIGFQKKFNLLPL